MTCASPIDISAGGRFEGSFVDVGDEEVVPCGFAGANDLLYQFTTAELHDVEISALSQTGERMNLELRSVCEDTRSALRCLSDAPARARVHELPAGTYYLVVESSPSREVDFSLDIAFLDPTPAPPGDGCGNPLPVTLGALEPGSLAQRQDLIAVECGCRPEESSTGCRSFLEDVVYEVQLDQPGDLGILINGGASPMSFDVRAVCGESASQLTCGNATLAPRRVRNLDAGSYYLIVESPDAASFTLLVEALPRTVPLSVHGNETCGTAFVVPPEGGLFTGDTLTMLNTYEAATCGGGARSNDAVYSLTLASESRVEASLEATFDTVLYRFTDTGALAESCVSDAESNCNDDGGQGSTDSLLSEVLGAGTYYYVVDGFNDNNEGAYLLEMTVTPQ
jgi:hypothetical protein